MQNKISGVRKRNICSPPAAESETRPKTGKCNKVFLHFIMITDLIYKYIFVFNVQHFSLHLLDHFPSSE